MTSVVDRTLNLLFASPVNVLSGSRRINLNYVSIHHAVPNCRIHATPAKPMIRGMHIHPIGLQFGVLRSEAQVTHVIDIRFIHIRTGSCQTTNWTPRIIVRGLRYNLFRFCSIVPYIFWTSPYRVIVRRIF